ncbi:MIF4G-domain-containing protein [Pisolithus thermaeus]|nr:MIF4G-domain-containing protein [Pisolithus thermaeus]
MATAATLTPVDSGRVVRRKRSRSRSSDGSAGPPPTRRRSRSPLPSRVKLDLPKVQDVDPVRRAQRERELAARMAAVELEKTAKPKEQDSAQEQADKEAEFKKLISNSRSGGVYIPPARLRAMQAAAATDKSSQEYQRLSWDALRKSITGIVNRVNIANIKQVVPELFSENLIRGRGLFARSVMKAQAASLPFTPVFAALVAIINTKLPQVGELVLIRLISQFRRAFKRNDKTVCHSSTTFIAHLVNQAVAHEIIALETLIFLLERPTDDSIEIAVGFMREVGAFLAENSPKANALVFDRFRDCPQRGNHQSPRSVYDRGSHAGPERQVQRQPSHTRGLDLVEEEEQITHHIRLEEELQVQEGLNIFKYDASYVENEEKYKAIKAEILGEGSEDESGSAESSEEEEEEAEEQEDILDRTGTNLVNLRRMIYLTIMNALNYEEAVHKLLKIQLKEEEEIELINMIIECCSQERSYSSFYGLVGERFSRLNRHSAATIDTIHRYETNRLRNIARFFGHMFANDAISWTNLGTIKMNEDDTTSSSRIFIKIMMQEMMESMGLKTLAERFKDEEIRAACKDMFPMDNPKNTRFSINYFTSIGLGILTEEMREYLKNAPRLIMEQRRALLEQESSSSDSDSSDDSDSDSDSDSASNSNDSNPDSDTVSDATESSLDSRRRARRSPTPRRDYSKDRSRGPVRSPDSSRGYTGRRGSPPHRRHESPPRRPREDGRERDRERERDRPRADVYDRRRRDDSRDRYYERERDRGYYSRDDGRRRDSYRDRSPSVRRGSPSPRRRRSDERDYDDRRR